MNGLKPSLKLHEVFEFNRMVIVYVGSQGSCHKYVEVQEAQVRQGLQVRVSKR